MRYTITKTQDRFEVRGPSGTIYATDSAVLAEFVAARMNGGEW